MSDVNEELHSSRKIAVPWTGGAPANYDIRANAPGGGGGMCCRRIVVANPTGAIVVIDGAGNTVTLPQALLLNSQTLDIALRNLVAAGSSAATVLVQW